MVELDYLVPPWNHQLETIEKAKTLPSFALLFEVGAGKTSTAINCLRYKYLTENRLLRTLVLGPPIIIQNWRREFYKHSKLGPEVVCLEGTGKQRLSLIKKHENSNKIFITNYESLLMKDVYEALLKWKPEAIIFDESHKLKSTKAKRTKAATKLADMAKYRYILTGTPILNTPMDIFSQFRILDGGEAFDKNFFVFRAKYFMDKNALMPRDRYFPNWVIRPGALDEINKKIKPVSMVVKKADCLDLPPLVRKEVFVELSKEQNRLYQEMKKDLITYVGDKACVANLAITKALRLQQIVSGFVTVKEDGEDPKNLTLKDNPRAIALKDLLEEITPSAKVLIWAVFKENYLTIKKVCESLGLDYVEVHGEVAASQRQKAVDRFTKEPNCKVFLGHPQSAGIGINLVEASYSIFYSRTFSLEHDIQAEGRNFRGGSEMHEKITRIDLIAKDTIDELISEKLAMKMDVSDKVLHEIIQKL